MDRAMHPAVRWLQTTVAPTSHLTTSSHDVSPGDVFLAYPGERSDGRHFIGQAIEHGAVAIVREAAHAQPWNEQSTLPHLDVSDLKQDCGEIASDWYGRPSSMIPCVAVTGTSGKTSCSMWIARCLDALGTSCAVAGTLGIGFADHLTDVGLTTPDPVRLQRTLSALCAQGAKAFVMEASSVGLEERRVAGMEFAVALFTNLTRDHLDYHGDMRTYERAKERLFLWPGLGAAVINTDDPAGVRMARITRDLGVKTIAYSARGDQTAALYARDIRYGASAMRFELHGAFGVMDVHTTLMGAHNVENLLGVFGTLMALGVEPADAGRALALLKAVPGRLELVGAPDAPLVLVDYAHKPDALEKVLKTCRAIATARSGRLVVIFGCGGDRDAGKRPIMGEIAARMADAVVVTSDNPRSEDPNDIIKDILAGVAADASHVVTEVDRARAIAQTLHAGSAADVILLAGKGDETYQEARGLKVPFSDRDHAFAALKARTGVTC